MMSELENLMNKLKLFGMKESTEYRLSEAMKDNATYHDLLTLLLEDEALYRANKRSNMLRARAKFRDKVILEDFEVSQERGLNKSMIKQMQTLRFMEESENLIFIGGTGVGKSFLAQAIGNVACQAGRETLFVSMNILYNQIAASEASGTYLSFLKRLSKAQLLILDDFGLRNYNHKEATILYQVLEDRYRKGSTIITSQVKTKGWKTLFDDKVIADAIVNRMESCAHVINLGGENQRERHAPKKKIAIDS
jgi:DNA replication protein DnaC